MLPNVTKDIDKKTPGGYDIKAEITFEDSKLRPVKTLANVPFEYVLKAFDMHVYVMYVYVLYVYALYAYALYINVLYFYALYVYALYVCALYVCALYVYVLYYPNQSEAVIKGPNFEKTQDVFT